MRDNSTGKDKDFYSKGKQTFDNIEPIHKQTIADVCMIARNAIDRITKLEGNKPRRKWAGLTDEEIWKGLTDADWSNIMDRRDTALDSFAQGAVWAADILKERNHD